MARHRAMPRYLGYIHFLLIRPELRGFRLANDCFRTLQGVIPLPLIGLIESAIV